MSSNEPKYQKYLCLTLDEDNIDYDKYEYDEVASNLCVFCGCRCKRTYVTYIHEIQIKTKGCYFCHVLMNFKKYHIGKVSLIRSDLKQDVINKKMMEYYYTNNEMMTLEDLDEDAKMVPIQSFEFANLIAHGDKHTKKIFKKIVVFFTDEIIKLLAPQVKNIFIKEKHATSTKYTVLNYPTYVLTADENNELIKLKKKKTCIENESSKIIMNNINNKINGVVESIDIINIISKKNL